MEEKQYDAIRITKLRLWSVVEDGSPPSRG
jgi:hypothetical protein